jgi:two-component system phosphate regulon response regulator PhoB
MKILIVDDEEITRALLRATLQSVTGDIREAANGVDALRIAREWRPDVVILDVVMPGTDGYEICYLIKTAPELRRTRVIMHTTRADSDGVATGREAHADAYIVKPFDPDKLVAAVREVSYGLGGEFPAGT